MTEEKDELPPRKPDEAPLHKMLRTVDISQAKSTSESATGNSKPPEHMHSDHTQDSPLLGAMFVVDISDAKPDTEKVIPQQSNLKEPEPPAESTS